jgi:hypothetical protein
MKSKKAAFFATLLLFSGGLFHQVRADEYGDADPGEFIHSRSYIGVFGTSSTIDQWGDFDGTKSMQSVPSSGSAYTEYDYIPEITRQFGWGVLLGHRQGPWAVEMSFWRSDDTAIYTGGGPTTLISEPASYQSLNIDIKRYMLTKLPAQPFVDLGLSFPWLWVRQDSYLVDSGMNIISIDDAVISGLGFNVGAGLEVYLDDNFSIVGGAYQRWTEFDQINGAAKIALDQMYFDGNPSDRGSLAGNGLDFYLGTTVGFK